MYELSSIAGYVCTQEKHFLEGSARYSVPRICWGFWMVSSLNKEEGCFFNFLSFYYFILSIYLSVCVGGVHSCHCVHMEVRGQLWKPVLSVYCEFQGANSGQGLALRALLPVQPSFPASLEKCLLRTLFSHSLLLHCCDQDTRTAQRWKG